MGRTMGTGNVHDDDLETLQFADEGGYGYEGADEPGPIAPPQQVTERSTWREHRECDWSWQITAPTGPDEAVCVAHRVVFTLPAEGEVYDL